MQKTTLIGQSTSFLNMLDKVSRLAKIDRPILIIGERGTGKELISKRLHYLSARWEQPLVSLNCAALNRDLIDSELFGHEAGAFTDAKRKHLGRFARAEQGTLFLDELATMPIEVQEKLLRVIEYGEYESLGGDTTHIANVRIIGATNTDLPKMVNKGEFRADLLDRLAFEIIHIPPLRERGEDILLLAQHFAISLCKELNIAFFSGFSSHVKRELLSYAWQGNVRELKNVVERSIIDHPLDHNNELPQINHLIVNPFITEETLALTTKEEIATKHDFPLDFKQWRQKQEIELLEKALHTHQYNQRKTAQALYLTYDQLRGLLKKHQLYK